MSKKVKDPYPITDVYHVTSSLIDAATVVVTDLCENLSNSIDTSDEDILSSLKKINTNKGYVGIFDYVDKYLENKALKDNENDIKDNFENEKQTCIK